MITFDRLESRQLFAAGSLDPSFGGDGSVDVRTNTNGYVAAANETAVDDAGRAVIASLYGPHKQISLTRLNVDGSLDTSFGKKGIATLALPTKDAANRTFQIAIDHAGKVLVLTNQTLTRLTTGGGVDKKFGTRGSLVVPVMASATDVTVDARDRPIVVGTSRGKTGLRGTIVRLGTRGVLDTGFGAGGAYKTPVPQDASYKKPGDATGANVRVLPNGAILGVVKVSYTYDDYGDGIAGPDVFKTNGISAFRLAATGALDTTYGTGGTVAITRNADDVTNAGASLQAFLPDGGLLALSNAASSDSPEPEPGDPRWTVIDASGKVKVARLDVTPASLPTPATDGAVSFRGVQRDGKLLFRSSGGDYRLTTSYALDLVFATSLGTTTIDRGDDLLAFAPTLRDGRPVNSTFSVTAIEV